jgi:hypothetical protein
MLISTALLLDSNIRNSVCTTAKLPCRRVEVGYEKLGNAGNNEENNCKPDHNRSKLLGHWLVKDK